MRVWRIVVLVGGGALSASALAACRGQERAPGASAATALSALPADVPRMLNAEPPFRYPAELYDRRVQGDVVLRLHVDAGGRVHPESTTVVSSSGYAALDSAAVRGASDLAFAPAVRKGRAIARSIRFPVWFRRP